MLTHNLKNILGLRLSVVAAAALALAACTSKEEVREVAAPEAVAFDAYLSRGVQTRAGEAGELTTSTGTYNLQAAGFGVFGYYTNDVLYSQAYLPNFMYNEKVYYESKWKYDIPKYWPNEYGSDALSETVDRVSFFAYAPWVNVDPATGLVTSGSLAEGITKITRAIDSGDPKVSYVASLDPSNCVDLCWGVASANFTSSLGSTEGTNSVTKGYPYLNVAKLAKGQKISYDFKHALAALNVQIDAFVDGTNNSNALDPGTRIYVRQVTFQGFATEGTLNLNNSAANTPLWVNYDANGAIPSTPVTIYDQRRDGREAIAAAAAELPGGLNEVIVQEGLQTRSGVTKTAVNLFDGSLEDPIYVIPNDDVLKVTIVYDVETPDPSILSTHLADGTTAGSVIENVITKSIALTMEPGKKYTLKLHLGMASVKFEASVNETWGAGGSHEADLPANE